MTSISHYSKNKQTNKRNKQNDSLRRKARLRYTWRIPPVLSRELVPLIRKTSWSLTLFLLKEFLLFTLQRQKKVCTPGDEAIMKIHKKLFSGIPINFTFFVISPKLHRICSWNFRFATRKIWAFIWYHKSTTSGWALGDENVIGVRSFKSAEEHLLLFGTIWWNHCLFWIWPCGRNLWWCWLVWMVHWTSAGQQTSHHAMLCQKRSCSQWTVKTFLSFFPNRCSMGSFKAKICSTVEHPGLNHVYSAPITASA